MNERPSGEQSGDRLEDYFYLCFNCGSITPVDSWAFFHYTEDGTRRKPKPNETDPVCECPVCLWEHVDDDSNPGISDGTYEDCKRERVGALPDWADGWDEAMTAVQARNGWTGREFCVESVRRGK